MTMLNRRSLITGLISLVAAPAIVRVASIMPVKVWRDWAAYEDLIAGLKADGIWDKLDMLHIHMAEEGPESFLINRITGQKSLSVQNAVTLVNDCDEEPPGLIGDNSIRR